MSRSDQLQLLAADQFAPEAVIAEDLLIQVAPPVGRILVTTRHQANDVMAALSEATKSWRLQRLGPREWHVTFPEASRDVTFATIRALVKGLSAIVVDISDAGFSVAVSGGRTRQILASGCSLDFDRCAPLAPTRTRFAQVPAIIAFDAATDAELVVGRAHARYLWSWLCNAARSAASAEL